MTDWSVEFDFESVPVGDDLEGRVEDVLEFLADYSAVVSYDERSLSVRLTVADASPEHAIHLALEPVAIARTKAGLGESPPIRIEVESMEELDRRIQESNAPELIGVAELAELIGVSRQRASELARSRDFPAPIVTLASGPIWRKAAVARHVSRWPRRPGRPRKGAVA